MLAGSSSLRAAMIVRQRRLRRTPFSMRRLGLRIYVRGFRGAVSMILQSDT